MITLQISEREVHTIIRLSDDYHQAKDYLEQLTWQEVYAVMQLMYLGQGNEFCENGDHKTENIRHLLGKGEWGEELALGLAKFKGMQINGFPKDFYEWWGVAD